MNIAIPRARNLCKETNIPKNMTNQDGTQKYIQITHKEIRNKTQETE